MSNAIQKKQDISFEGLLFSAMQVPGVRVERDRYLRSALQNHFSEEIIEKAIELTPAAAGITVAEVTPIANGSIKFESAKAVSLSAAAGIPGGLAMVGTVPADMAQFLAHVLRVIQKLAYLYGWQDFYDASEDDVDDQTKALFTLFLGVMFGAAGAEAGINKVAEMLAANALKKLPQKALTKGVVYPIVKKVAAILGQKMTKEVFAKGVSKAIPVVGAVLSGGLTAATFMPMSFRLKDYLATLELADPKSFDGIPESEVEIVCIEDVCEE